jgi:membrane-associated protease RseP (regulator of RpoE activity)
MLKLRAVGIGALAALVLAAVVGVLVFRAVGHGSSASAASAQQQKNENVWLGIAFARTPQGLTIDQVIAGSPADKASLKRGDTIKTVNGTPVQTVQDLRDQLKDKNVGDTISLNIERDGQSQDVSVTLEAPPAPLLKANPLLPELEGISPDQLFSHMQGGQFNLTDKDGNKFTVTIDVGTVASVDSGTKSLTVNLNAGGTNTYTVEDNAVRGGLASLKQGDNVAVVRVGDNVRLVMQGFGALLPGIGGGHGFGGGFERGPMGHFGGWGGKQGGTMTPQKAPSSSPGTGL